MDAWLSTLLLAAACALWIHHVERRREQRRLAALAIAQRLMRAPVLDSGSESDQRSVARFSTLSPELDFQK